MKMLTGFILGIYFSFSAFAQENSRIKHISYSFTSFGQDYNEVTKDSLLMTVEFSVNNLDGLRGVSVKLGTDSFPDLFSSEYLKVIIREGRKYLHGASGLYAISDGKISYRKTVDRSKCNGVTLFLLVEEHQLKGELLRKQFQYQF